MLEHNKVLMINRLRINLAPETKARAHSSVTNIILSADSLILLNVIRNQYARSDGMYFGLANLIFQEDVR